MSAKGLGSRAIIGTFYDTLEQGKTPWVEELSMLFQSDQEFETYKWLGMSPVMREWIGGRNAKGFRENGLTIENKHFEATLEVLVKELRRDKTGQILVRVREMADRVNSHWASLLTTLIINAASTTCYDGQYFFDTDHTEGQSGTQSNSISLTLSALSLASYGTSTNPSVEAMQACILRGVQQMYGFKDDQGEPLNENARSFLVMVPTPLWQVAGNAVNVTTFGGGATNLLPQHPDVRVRVTTNPRLPWTDKFAIFRTDGRVKPFIRQEEEPVHMKGVAEGSELEFYEDKHHYGIDCWRNVGLGYWQHAVQVTMV